MGKFRTRSGAIDRGRDYENLNIANIILNIIFDKDVKNFEIASNAEEYGAFDDIVLEIEYTNGSTEEYVIQLKHVHSNKTLAISSLLSQNGKFSIAKYFQSYKAEIKNVNAKMILFTNFKFDGKDLDFSMETVKVKSVDDETECEAVSFLRAAETSGICKKFKLVEDKPVCDDLSIYRNFFKNFSLYTNQPSSTHLKEIVSRKFRDYFECDKELFEKYLLFINEWSKKEGVKNKLQKAWIQQAIAIRLLTPYIRPMLFVCSEMVQHRSTILTDAISRFNVTIFRQEAESGLVEIWGDFKKDLSDVEILNKVKQKFYLNMDYIKDVKKLNYLEKTQLLWLMDKCPLIVPETSVTSKAIDLYPKGKFILLTEKDNKNAFQYLSDLTDYPEIYKSFMNFPCSVQGMEVSLQSLLEQDEELKSKITTNELLAMVKDKPFLIGEKQEDLPNPHIERKLSTAVIKISEYLGQIEKEDQKTLIVISCNKEYGKIKKYLKNFNLIKVEGYLKGTIKAANEKNVYLDDEECSQKDFDRICDKNKTIKQCHHFRVTDDGNLEWIKTKGNTEDLEPFIFEDRSIDQSELYSTNPGNNINVICANPGMGKSILTKSLKNKLSSKFWTLIVHPADISAYFRKKRNDDFEMYIEKKFRGKYSNFEVAVMDSFKNKKQIVYIWDGLDEISDHHLKKVLEIIESLSRKGFLQFLAARCHLQDKLENKFKVFARTIRQFDDEQQETYIRQRLEGVPKDINKIIKKIKYNIQIIQCHEVLGIPLQIYMLTELFKQDPEKYSELLSNLFSLADLYQHFVNEKFNHCYKDKAKVERANDFLQQVLEAHKKSYVKKYEKAALKALEEPELFKNLNVDCDEFLAKIRKDCDAFGLITEVSDNMIPTFVHNSFGEFLVASYLFKNYKKIPNLKNFLFKERYTNIRFLFDLLMAKDSPVHIAVLYKNKKVLIEQEDKLSCKDQGGRNALQLVCTWGQTYPLLNTTPDEENDTYQIYDKLGEPVEEEDPKYREIFEYLLERCSHEDVDQLFQMNSMLYADTALCFFPIMEISRRSQVEIENLSNFNDFGSLLYYALKFDSDHLIDLVNDVPLVKTEKRGLSLLHLCAEFNSTKCLKKLLSVEKYKIIINSTDIYEVFPAMIACRKGRVNILQILIDEGADLKSNVFQLIQAACKGGHHEIVRILLNFDSININDDRRSITSSLQTVCISGYHQIVQMLVKFGVDVNVNTRHGTPLFIASQYGHEEIVRILIKAAANINKANKFGFTPLHIACQQNHIEIVKFLLESQADINVVDNKGITPLHVVSKNGNGDILLILVKSEADVKKSNKKKVTPLHNACQYGDEKIVSVLIDAGAEINCSCSEGFTPLYVACKQGNKSVVELLLSFSADVNISSVKGILPRQAAEENGFLEIVQLL